MPKIDLDQDVYHTLAAMKSETETFSDLIASLISGVDNLSESNARLMSELDKCQGRIARDVEVRPRITPGML